MMPLDPTITREIPAIPERKDDAHKGDVGRLAVVGGCAGEVLMVGACALTANAAFRSGAGLVQLIVPEPLRASAAVLAPCATTCTLPDSVDGLLDAVRAFHTDVVAFGPGLGDTLPPDVVAEFLARFERPIVVDADGLNRIAEAPDFAIPDPGRVVMTPHPGEARRLLAARGVDVPSGNKLTARRRTACALVETYGCVAVLKGRGTVVTNGQRLYVNETGNAGMATGGSGDVLTGILAALIGQGLETFEASMLAVYLHGLAGDFASEELGRWATTALDLIEYLPEAFCEHELSAGE
jgi:NAD(P)H-hydrate epimerase